MTDGEWGGWRGKKKQCLCRGKRQWDDPTYTRHSALRRVCGSRNAVRAKYISGAYTHATFAYQDVQEVRRKRVIRGNKKGSFLSFFRARERREKQDRALCQIFSSFLAFARKRKELKEETTERWVKRLCRGEIDSSICHGRDLCILCRYACYLRAFRKSRSSNFPATTCTASTKQSKSSKQNAGPNENVPNEMYSPPNHGYELLIIRASHEFLYGFSFSAFLFRVALCLARWSFPR